MNEAWSRPSRYLVFTILLVLTALFVYSIRQIIGPIAIAALVAYLLQPFVLWLVDHSPLTRKGAVYLVVLLFLALAVLLPTIATPVLIEQADTIRFDFVRLLTVVNLALKDQGLPGFNIADLSAEGELFLDQYLEPGTLYGILRSTTENVIWILVILITTYYLLLDWPKLRAWLDRIIPEKYRGDAARLYAEISSVWRYFLRGHLVSMLVNGLMSVVAAAAIGMPGPIALGLIGGLLAVLPSVGSTIMIGVAAVVAFFSEAPAFGMSTALYMLLAIGAFSLISFLENYWLRPSILGHRLRLHPGLILVAIIGALTLGGILEALLIVPVIRSLEIVLGYLMRRILALEPWPDEATT